MGSGEFSRIFALKVTLQCVRLLLTVTYINKLGEQDVLVVPPIILLGEKLLPLLPRFPRLWHLSIQLSSLFLKQEMLAADTTVRRPVTYSTDQQ